MHSTEETELATRVSMHRYAFDGRDGTSSMKDLHGQTQMPCADEHGNLVHIPSGGGEPYGEPKQAAEHQEGGADEANSSAAQRCWSLLWSAIEGFQYAYSLGLLLFSVTLVMTAMLTRQTVATGEALHLNPAVACVLFWFLVVWLATMEGGQGALVGLQPVDPLLYRDTHQNAFGNTRIAHRSNNMERFIVGRQFLVVLVVFAINMVASAVPDASVLNLPALVNEIFLGTGLALILTTITLGQLTAQVNAANCMLDFINNYFVRFTIYVSLAIETSGLLHSVYLVQIVFAKISGVGDNNPDKQPAPLRTSLGTRVWFWTRVFVSLAILGIALAVTLQALFEGKTTMYEGVPRAASVVIFFVLMCFVGMMEGMQIALFAVVNLPQEELTHHPMAAKVCKLTFEGNNLQAFLIGRQICVTICMFIVAHITDVNVDTTTGDSENIFGVSDGLQNFFNTGLLGAVITTLVGSLAWRIIASSFPVAFLSNPLIYVIIRLCLFLEASGICSAAWILAYVQKYVLGYQQDQVFIGTPEERAAGTADIDVEKVVSADLDLQEENSNND